MAAYSSAATSSGSGLMIREMRTLAYLPFRRHVVRPSVSRRTVARFKNFKRNAAPYLAAVYRQRGTTRSELQRELVPLGWTGGGIIGSQCPRPAPAAVGCVRCQSPGRACSSNRRPSLVDSFDKDIELACKPKARLPGNRVVGLPLPSMRPDAKDAVAAVPVRTVAQASRWSQPEFPLGPIPSATARVAPGPSSLIPARLPQASCPRKVPSKTTSSWANCSALQRRA